jgi:hypothetical protein
MNQYNNKFGYHSPKKTEETFKILSGIFPNLNWEDGSWRNDTCDSIYLEDGSLTLTVYIPNSEKIDLSNEEVNTWGINIDGQDTDDTYTTIELVIAELKKHL